MRFSLRWLFGSVAFIAVGCMSMVYASWVASEILGACLWTFLVCAILGAIYGRKAERAFWGGCAIAGCSYVLFLYAPNVQRQVHLPTAIADRAIRNLYNVVSKELPAEQRNGTYPEGTYFANSGAFIRRPMWDPFTRSGQVVFAFAVAILGGCMGRLFRSRSDRDADEPSGAAKNPRD